MYCREQGERMRVRKSLLAATEKQFRRNVENFASFSSSVDHVRRSFDTIMSTYTSYQTPSPNSVIHHLPNLASTYTEDVLKHSPTKLVTNSGVLTCNENTVAVSKYIIHALRLLELVDMARAAMEANNGCVGSPWETSDILSGCPSEIRQGRTDKVLPACMSNGGIPGVDCDEAYPRCICALTSYVMFYGVRIATFIPQAWQDYNKTLETFFGSSDYLNRSPHTENEDATCHNMTQIIQEDHVAFIEIFLSSASDFLDTNNDGSPLTFTEFAAFLDKISVASANQSQLRIKELPTLFKVLIATITY